MVYLSRYFLLKWKFVTSWTACYQFFWSYNPHIARVATYEFKSSIIATRIMISIPLTRYEFRLFPFRSPLLGELTFVLYSCRYWEVSLPCVTICTAMNSLQDNWVWAQLGFPIRKSPDQSLFDSYPRLIAAYHVLLRFFAPRHSPYALSSLNWNFFLFSCKCATTDIVNPTVKHWTYLNRKDMYIYLVYQRLKISLLSLLIWTWGESNSWPLHCKWSALAIWATGPFRSGGRTKSRTWDLSLIRTVL